MFTRVTQNRKIFQNLDGELFPDFPKFYFLKVSGNFTEILINFTHYFHQFFLQNLPKFFLVFKHFLKFFNIFKHFIRFFSKFCIFSLTVKASSESNCAFHYEQSDYYL